ncbi:potassium/proton antiporter [compost metagenome]
MQISQLELPGDILFTAIIRNKSIVTPHGNTVIEPGDTVYVLSPKSKRDEMRAIFRSGKGKAAESNI